MNRHRPNYIPLKTRVFLAVCALFLIVFVLAELAFGYTYLPLRRGGVLLSGIPSLMLAIAATALLSAALLTIIDHYDKRPNEARYVALKSACYKTAIILFIGAPLFELTENFLRQAGYNPFPSFHGIASNYSLHSPELKAYAQYLEPIFERLELIVGLGSFLALGMGYATDKFMGTQGKRLVFIIGGIGMICLSLFWLVVTIHNLMIGEVSAGSHGSTQVIHAQNQPAKFNAILLTHFSLGGFMLLTSIVVVIGVITNRIKPEYD